MQNIKLYHGTNRIFKEHDNNRSRTELNDKYQGDWICYTKDLDVAWKYANAARNQNIDNKLFLSELPKVLNDLSQDEIAKNFIIDLTNEIIKEGYENGWDKTIKKYETQVEVSEIISRVDSVFESVDLDNHFNDKKIKMNIDDYCDIIEHLENSKKDEEINSAECLINMFNNQIDELPTSVLKSMKKVGFKKSIPTPTVYKSIISFNKKLETSDPEEAKSAKEKGYDLVIYKGNNTVDDIPEYLIKDSSQVKIIKTLKNKNSIKLKN